MLIANIRIQIADLSKETVQHLSNAVVAGMPLIGPEDKEVTLNSDDINEAIGHCFSNSSLLSVLTPSKPPVKRVLQYVPELSDFEKILEGNKNTTIMRKVTDQSAPSKPTSNTEAQAKTTQVQTNSESDGWLHFEFDDKLNKLMPDVPPNTNVVIETGSGDERFITFANANEPLGKDFDASVDSAQDLSSKAVNYPFADGQGYPRYSFNRKYLYGYKDGALIVQYKAPVPDHYEFAEHRRLGNDLKLKWKDNQVYDASQKKITLNSKLQLTYGEINGLAGDFYGTKEPICQGETFKKQVERFAAAYATLAGDEETVPEEVKILLKNRQDEVEMLEAAICQPKISTAKAYEELEAKGRKFLVTLPDWVPVDDAILNFHTRNRQNTPTYLTLARLNFDHFGADAHTAYNAGHYKAMEAAANGNLELGYAMNAFADHFLGDLFASGHMRTPRRLLHYGEKPGINPGFLDKATPYLELLPDYCAGVRSIHLSL
jgi:hypothetical protein